MALSSGVDQNQTTSRILNKLHYALANDAADLTTGATGDIVIMLDASDNYEPKYADAANVMELLGITSSSAELNITDGLLATAAELNAVADATTRLVSITDTSAYTVLVANSSKTHTVPDLGQNITITLPTPATGLEYRFVYRGVAADASNWLITTGSDTNYYIGGLTFIDHDTDVVAPIAGDGNSNSKLTVVTPTVGTELSLICDGTLWILHGHVNSATIPSFADQ